MLIPEATFVVTDLETTGTSAARDRVIELAAVKVRGGEVVDQFARLVNPGRSVPRRITSLTGISTGMVFEQPSMAAVLPGYLRFLGDDVFVAHNAGFDQGFLHAEQARLGQAPFENPVLCTLRLARRLLSGLRSKSLTNVAAFYGLTRQGHRALGDAEVTAQVLLRFFSHLAYEHGVETLDDLMAFQYRTYRRTRLAPKHVQHIRDEVLPALPERPGVYFMKDRQGAVIYVGKAKRLRTRVRSYFTGIEAHTERLHRLVEQVRDVTWEETGSELAALLLESELIKTLKPRFNRAQRRYRNRPFIRLDTHDAFPRVSWNPFLMDDGAEYFGPVGGRGTAAGLVELIDRYFQLRACDDTLFAQHRRCIYAEMGRCLAPCDTPDADRYTAEVERVRNFLLGRDRTVLTWLEDQMKAAAGRLAFEEARTYRDWLQRLTPLLDKQQGIAAPVLEHHAVLVLPGVAAGTVQLLLVRFGRHVESLTLSPEQADTPEEAARVHDALARHFHPGVPRPERYHKREVDEVRLLAHWMYTNRGKTHQVRWHEGLGAAQLAEAVFEQVKRVRRRKAAQVEKDDAA